MDKSIIEEINNIDNKKKNNASPIEGENIKYITDNFQAIDPKKINFLSKNVDRINTIGSLALALKNIDSAIKLEAGIFEFTLVYGLIKNYLNVILPSVYNDKVNDILKNLDQNSSTENYTLLNAINTGSIDPQTVAFLRPHEIHPDRWEKLIQKNKLREEKKKNIATTDIYQCYKCKGRRCSMIELQLRSADEPMTKIITCLDCQTVMKK
jgi:transcription elongation factor S-II